MALQRKARGVLPLWSRMAIAELAAGGATYNELMAMFRVGRSTVYRAVHKVNGPYSPLSGQRILTSTQRLGPRRV